MVENAHSIRQWLLGEMVAHGLIEKQGSQYVVPGEPHDYLVTLETHPFRSTMRLVEPKIDLGYD